ncbi:MAG: hypothetical protein JSS72_06010 [Armatimonadetes bacterium]|nr:hypothetical protein [Armatimonadota bacterium]
MGSAYTPGLTVSGDVAVKRTRRLPIKGEVLVAKGAKVTPDTTIARAMLPGPLQTIKLSEKLGMEAKDAVQLFQLKVGDSIEKGQKIAESKGFLGLGKQTILSDYTGVVETVSEVSGSVLIREPSIPVDIDAYIEGEVVDIMPEEGAIVEARGAMVQGIFGVGGERRGTIRVAVSSPNETLDAGHIQADDAGKILIGGNGITYEAMTKAVEVGAAGLVAGGIKDSDLTKFIGYDIGVAITGQEAIGITMLVTEGFGFLTMAERTFELFKTLSGKHASINGATQIRAGVIRPEVIVPLAEEHRAAHAAGQVFELTIGTPIRVIREPYFGRIGAVTELPPTLVELESGTEVRVLRAKLENQEEVTVPRANVEIIAT